MKWCRSCILPDTRPNLTLDADGICNACRNHGTKRQIDWNARAAALRDAAATAKAAASGYDCLIPVSGGKDSTWQTVKCLELGLKPLAARRLPGRTAIGQRNLDNLIGLGVTSTTASTPAERKLMLMVWALRFDRDRHAPGLFAIPLTLAVRFRIPLVVWARTPRSNTATPRRRTPASRSMVHGSEPTADARHQAADWIGEGPVPGPHALCLALDEELAAAGVCGVSATICPGTHRRPIVWPTRMASAKTRPYRLLRLCRYRRRLHRAASLMKWYKFGFTRLFDNPSLKSAMAASHAQPQLKSCKTGDDTPHRDIATFCRFWHRRGDFP